jgi:hypothetical protein
MDSALSALLGGEPRLLLPFPGMGSADEIICCVLIEHLGIPTRTDPLKPVLAVGMGARAKRGEHGVVPVDPTAVLGGAGPSAGQATRVFGTSLDRCDLFYLTLVIPVVSEIVVIEERIPFLKREVPQTN